MISTKRKDHEPPYVTAKLGWRYHHLGIPIPAPRPGMTAIPELKISVSGFETSPYGIQWMRFDHDSGLPEAIRTLQADAPQRARLALAGSRRCSIRRCWCGTTCWITTPSTRTILVTRLTPSPSSVLAETMLTRKSRGRCSSCRSIRLLGGTRLSYRVTTTTS